jgi:hypothetical protein
LKLLEAEMQHLSKMTKSTHKLGKEHLMSIQKTTFQYYPLLPGINAPRMQITLNLIPQNPETPPSKKRSSANTLVREKSKRSSMLLPAGTLHYAVA